MMDFIPARQQIGDRFRRGVVRDRAADDVGHVAMIALLREPLLGVTVEAAEGGEVDVPAEDGDADVVFRGDVLQGLDEVFALMLVLARGVVVV